MSLACDSAIEFDPDNPTLPPPAPAKQWNGYKNSNGDSNGNGYAKKNSGSGNGNDNGNGNAKKAADTNIREKKALMTTSYDIPADPQKVVRLAVTESDDPSRDAHLLREVIGVLLEYPGRDRVNLDIRTGERLVRMDLPVVSTGYCEALHGRLEEILGPDTVAVHQELGLGMEQPEEKPVTTMPLEAAPPPAASATQEIQPEPVPEPEMAAEATPVAVEGPQIPVSVASDVPAVVGADLVGDEPPF
jgi:hypothetical protein